MNTLFQTSEAKAGEITKNRERGTLCLGRQGGMGIFAVSLCDDLMFLRPYTRLMVTETKTHKGLTDPLGLSVNGLFVHSLALDRDTPYPLLLSPRSGYMAE